MDGATYGEKMSVDPMSTTPSVQINERSTPGVICLESDSPIMKMLSLVACAFADRCSQFHKLLVKLLSHRQHPTTASTGKKDMMDEDKEKLDDSPLDSEIFQVASLHKQLSLLQNSCVELENQLEEMAHARDEANDSERRVRRALYRLASGRLKVGEVLQVNCTIFSFFPDYPLFLSHS